MTKEKKPGVETRDLNKELRDAEESGCPTIYFNGYANILGTGDVLMMLHRNGKPTAVLNASYTVAKSLSISLSEIVRTLETRSGNAIMTTKEVEDHLSKSKEH
jgi:hypothetical protein